MALNVKAAMFICTGFISGLCWLVSEVALPEAGVGPPGTELSLARLVAPEAPRAVEVVSSLAHPSPFELLANANRAQGGRERMTVASVPVPLAAVRPATLPPVADATAAAEAFAKATKEPARVADAVRGTRLAIIAPASEPVGLRGASALAQVDSTPALRTYKVKKGDNLTKISRQQFKSKDARLVRLLVEANPKLHARQDKVLVGEELVLPGPAVVKRVLAGEKPPLALAALAASAKSPGAPAPKTSGLAGRVGGGLAERLSERRTGGTPGWHWYTVRKSDSLTSIARRFLKDGRRWREIAELNSLGNPNRLLVGHKIKLPRVFALASG